MIPHSIRMVVVLPLPFGPRKAKTSPRFTWKETSSTAVNSPNRLVRCSASTAYELSAISFQLSAFSSVAPRGRRIHAGNRDDVGDEPRRYYERAISHQLSAFSEPCDG